MTECERLISEGFLPESFFADEKRSGHTVTHETKKIWAIYLDLLREFITVCEKSHLRYWAGFGTLLGAVRHHGFIPWDDDIDIWMPRDDYNKLVSMNSEFIEPYFLRTVYTETSYYYSYCCLCNSNTTFIGFTNGCDCNQGMSISIMPLDGVDPNTSLQKMIFRKLKLMSIAGHSWAFNINGNPLTRAFHKFTHLPCIRFDARRLFIQANRLASRYPWYASKYVGVLIYAAYEYSRNIYPKSAFEETIQVNFENLSIAIPAGYDQILRIIYGNYECFPPVSQRGLRHSAVIDTDLPYYEYVNCVDAACSIGK